MSKYICLCLALFASVDAFIVPSLSKPRLLVRLDATPDPSSVSRIHKSRPLCVSSEGFLQRTQPKQFRLSKAAAVLLSLFATATVATSAAVAKSAAASSAVDTTGPVVLGWRQLLSAASLLVVSGGIGLSLQGLPALARSLLTAATRATLQLYLIGGFLLTNFLISSNTKPWMVIGWILFSSFVASKEASARVQYSYPRLVPHLGASLVAGLFSTLALTLGLQIMGPMNPWFSPRTWIPVSGMLIGNSLTAISLSAATLTSTLATSGGQQIEERLLRGASWREAMSPVLHSTLTTALTPTINALSVAGIVHIPGMMTGQILAGQPPYQAAAYQMVIFFLIASMAATATQTFLLLMTGDVVDKWGHRLRFEILRPQTKDSSSSSSSWLGSIKAWVRSKKKKIGFRKNMLVNGSSNKPIQRIAKLERSLSFDELKLPSPPKPVLSLKDLAVKRINTKVTLDLYPGERVAIQGQSGSGKSQVLRTIAGLEERKDDSSASLEGVGDVPLPTWRSRVSLVSQDRTAVEETPRQFYEAAKKYRSQKRRARALSKSQGSEPTKTPMDIAKEWGLPESAFDQAWTTLSGGEAQRASLAIALALRPQVVLLDESLSALDELTALKVERTLAQSGLPILMVSHSQSQIDRFCSRVLDLENTTADLAAMGVKPL